MSSAIETAKRTLERHWDKTLPVNPSAIAYAMGAKIVYDPDLSISGYFDFQDDRKPVIYVNPLDSFVRQRFTIFHELGHYALGHGPSARDPSQNYDRQNYDICEVMANQFAAEMIMPSDVVFLYANGDYSLAQMAHLFNVSEQAMRIRLERLGIL